MKKQFLMMVVLGSALVAGGCATAKPKPVQKPVSEKQSMSVKGYDGRADVRKTVSNLVNYCEEWAKAYEIRLGKNYTEGYAECVELTAEMMRKEAMKSQTKKAPEDGFPFID